MNLKQVQLSKCKNIYNQKGNLKKLLDLESKSFLSFGEIYLTKIKYRNIKGWKSHKKMNSNIFLLSGKVMFIIVEIKKKEIKFHEYILSMKTNDHIFIPKNKFFSFYGLSKTQSVLLNLSSIKHDTNETVEKNLDYFEYKWKSK